MDRKTRKRKPSAPVSRVPPPNGVMELTDLGFFSIVELNDGSLLADNGRRSTDGGRSWSEPRPLAPHLTSSTTSSLGNGLIRLASGALLYACEGMVSLSRDEGRTWGPTVEACPGMIGLGYFGDELIQIEGGRLLYPMHMNFSPRHPEFERQSILARGFWRDTIYATEGHHHQPEFYFSFAVYSDDEGKTWHTPHEEADWSGALMGWFDEQGFANGRCGALPFGEATMAETGDHHVLLMGRSTVSRVLQTRSADGGTTWTAVLPSMLANSGSPVRLRRIPSTGDLLLVWNQVSREEVSRGYRRGRLSAAISKDGGHSWENHKTIELSTGLEDIARIPPESPITMVRSRHHVGYLPEEYAYYHYANVTFAGDRVFVVYNRGMPLRGIAELNLQEQQKVLRIYPLSWFYS